MNTARREGWLLKTREDPWFSQSPALEASETLVITSTHNVRDTTSASSYFSYPTLPPRWRAGQADQARQTKPGLRKEEAGSLRGLPPALKEWPPETMRTVYPLPLFLAWSCKSSP